MANAGRRKWLDVAVGLLLFVPSLGSADLSSPAAALLTRAREKIGVFVHGMPEHACIQTTDRQYFRQTRETGGSCDDLAADKRKRVSRLELISTDRVRLDVHVDGTGNEVYRWPGAKGPATREIEQLIGGGPFGTGSFGTFLVGIFGDPGAQIDYVGPSAIANAAVWEYRYRVPVQASHYELLDGGVAHLIGYDGSFWLNPASADLEKLTVRTAQLPRETESCEATTTVEFERKQVGAKMYLLPRESSLEYLYIDGSESASTTKWSQCHLANGNHQLTTPGSPVPRQIRSGLHVALKLQSTLDRERTAAGDEVQETVVEDVLDAVTKQVVIPAGGLVICRVLHFEHYLRPDYFILTLSPERVQLQKGWARIAAIRDAPPEAVQSSKRLLARPDFQIFQSHALGWGGGTFVFNAKKLHPLAPLGLTSTWLTIPVPLSSAWLN